MPTNALNHTNPGGFVGQISSPQFGMRPASTPGSAEAAAAATANNRRVELGMRLQF